MHRQCSGCARYRIRLVTGFDSRVALMPPIILVKSVGLIRLNLDS